MTGYAEEAAWNERPRGMKAAERPWERAAREAVADEPPDSLGEAAREVLAALWSDLDEARDRAHSGSWSMGCDWVTRSIVLLARHVGATRWQEVPVPLLADGVYQGILRAAGIEFTEPDAAEVARLNRPRQVLGGGGGPRAGTRTSG